MNPIVHIYTDGAIRGNPGGLGGYAAVLLAPLSNGRTQVLEIAGAEAGTTNNRMEVQAALAALRALKRPSKVTLYSDSQYVVKGMSEWIRGWLRRSPSLAGTKNADLWLQMLEASAGHEVTWKWVRGHSGVRWNERADKLAGEAIKNLKGGGFATWQSEGTRYVLSRRSTP